MTTQPAQLTAAGRPPPSGFGGVVQAWLARTTSHNQQGLAAALQVDPSTVTGWVRGHKRPELRALVQLLITFRAWLGDQLDVREALDAVACLGVDWATIQTTAAERFQKGGILRPS